MSLKLIKDDLLVMRNPIHKDGESDVRGRIEVQLSVDGRNVQR